MEADGALGDGEADAEAPGERHADCESAGGERFEISVHGRPRQPGARWSRSLYWTDLSQPVFCAARFCAAERAFRAAAILVRGVADIERFFGTGTGAAFFAGRPRCFACVPVVLIAMRV